MALEVSNHTTLTMLSRAHLGGAEGCGPSDLDIPVPLDCRGMSVRTSCV